MSETRSTSSVVGDGMVTAVSGPIVRASGMAGASMYEMTRVGDRMLTGEVVRLEGDHAWIQVYEDTTMLAPGALVRRVGRPLCVTLGPGLLGGVFDGVQRPLPAIASAFGAWIQPGVAMEPLDARRRWTVVPRVQGNVRVSEGTVLGVIEETPLVTHSVMVPHGVEGVFRWTADVSGVIEATIHDALGVIESERGVTTIRLAHTWPVRRPRPIRARRGIEEPLLTGQRVIDTFFPMGMGGAAAIPGGFGTGKTMTQHQLAKWANADVIVFIGCGERGNEMTEVLRQFPELIDPRRGRPLMERTILVANTSNMPVAAREVSIHTGIAIAEYYRDMGLDVAVFADSTSRWAEALRELAARMEEMPAEEGFPASLASCLASFYERGGAVTTLGGARGSISIVGAVSPPGGDFSEPVTQHTQRFTRCFWALDPDLANARHYPSIHWMRSYSEYGTEISGWWAARAEEWSALREEAMGLLQREDRLQQIVRLVGPDALPEEQRWILFAVDLLRDGFLTQSALDERDSYCSPERQMALLRLIMRTYHRGLTLMRAGVSRESIEGSPLMIKVLRAKTTFGNDELAGIVDLEREIESMSMGEGGS